MDGIIYKIEICNEIYIGSTIENLIERERKHNYMLKKKHLNYMKLVKQMILIILL